MATFKYAHERKRQSDQVSGRSDSVQQQMEKATFNTIKSTGAAATYRESSHMLL